MKLVTLKAAFGAAVAGLALVAGHAAGDAQAASAGHPLTMFKPLIPAVSLPHVASPDEAVRAGRLDAAVLDALRVDGSVDALVAFESSFVTRSVAFDAQTAATTRALALRVRGALDHQEDRVLLAEPGVKVLHELGNLPLSFVRFTSTEALLGVVNAAGVTGVRENRHGTATTAQSLQLIRQPTAVAAGNRGNGTYVAVLDTGVDFLHADFGCTGLGVPATCRVTHAQEFADADGKRDDGSFHGSNVAGIVAKTAPGAKILAFDVFEFVTRYDEFGFSYQSQEWTAAAIAKAINRAITLKSNGLNIVAMNLSLGVSGTFETTACSKGWELESPFALAHDWGILPVTSSGNSAIDEGEFQNGIGYPACLADAFTVGAVHDSAHPEVLTGGYCEAGSAADQLTSFTQSGPNLDVLAPGSCIVAGGRTMNGTSQAAPHVAGAAAILAAARFGSTRFYEQDLIRIENALRTSGKAIYDGRSGVTRNRLDIPAALQALGTGSGGTDTTAPTMGSVVENFDGPVSSSGAIVKISWSATDANGIAEFGLYSRVNGGPWTRQTIAATATSARFTLAFGTKVEFAVQAKDPAGNWSGHAYSPALTPGYSDDSTWSLPGWTRYNWSSAFGGTYVTSSQANASITYTFTGRDVGLVAAMFSTAGRAHVYCDGAFKSTIDLSSSTLRPRELAYWCRFAQSGTHTMRIVVEGTTGRPRVDVDAFVHLS